MTSRHPKDGAFVCVMLWYNSFCLQLCSTIFLMKSKKADKNYLQSYNKIEVGFNPSKRRIQWEKDKEMVTPKVEIPERHTTNLIDLQCEQAKKGCSEKKSKYRDTRHSQAHSFHTRSIKNERLSNIAHVWWFANPVWEKHGVGIKRREVKWTTQDTRVSSKEKKVF